MSELTITVEIDPTADAAYIVLTQNDVARTVEFSPELAVDLDSLDVVVGVELLTLSSSITDADINSLIGRFHVPSNLQGGLHVALDVVGSWARDNTALRRTDSAARRQPYGTLHSTPKAVLEECS